MITFIAVEIAKVSHGTQLQEFFVLDPGPRQPPETSLSCSLHPSGDIYVYVQPVKAVSLAEFVNTIDVVEVPTVPLPAKLPQVSAPACQVPEVQFTDNGISSDLFVETSTGDNEPDIDDASSDLFAECGKRGEEHSYSGRRGTALQRQHKYACALCPFTTPHRSVMARHRLLHTGEKPHRCEVCGRTYRLRATLVTHLRTHTDERPYSCKMCPRTFRFVSCLQLHERSHTGDRPYVCTVCDQAFKSRDSVKRHMRIHTGERPYKCEFCAMTFVDLGCKLRHIQRKHTVDKKPA